MSVPEETSVTLTPQEAKMLLDGLHLTLEYVSNSELSTREGLFNKLYKVAYGEDFQPAF